MHLRRRVLGGVPQARGPRRGHSADEAGDDQRLLQVDPHAVGEQVMHGQQTAGRTVGYPWRQPGDWWLKNSHYIMYMIRELTAVFAALWVVVFLAQIAANGQSVAKWRDSL